MFWSPTRHRVLFHIWTPRLSLLSPSPSCASCELHLRFLLRLYTHTLRWRLPYLRGLLVSYWPPWAVEEGEIASCFGQGLELALVEKTCPHRPQANKKVKMSRRFRRKTFFLCSFFFFLNEPIAGTPRYVCKQFHAKIRRSGCVGRISSHI